MNEYLISICKGALACLALVLGALSFSLIASPRRGSLELLHASFDTSREILAAWHQEINDSPVSNAWGNPNFRISNAGSAAQARAVRDGLPADIVSLNFEPDWQILAKAGLVPSDWRSHLPEGMAPWHSSLVLVVRKGNPFGIRDWEDLLTKPVKVIMPNPKTSGVARLAVLSFWEARRRAGNSETADKDLIALCKKVPVFDPSMRTCTTTFAQKGIGDVQITWEPEAWLEVGESGGKLELVRPKSSFRIEPAIGMVEPVAKSKGTILLVQKYLEWIYNPTAQEILAKYHFRPLDKNVEKLHQDQFPPVEWITIQDIAGDWDKAVEIFFRDGGLVDRALQEAAKR